MSMMDEDLNKLDEEKNGEGYLIFTLAKKSTALRS